MLQFLRSGPRRSCRLERGELDRGLNGASHQSTKVLKHPAWMEDHVDMFSLEIERLYSSHPGLFEANEELCQHQILLKV